VVTVIAEVLVAEMVAVITPEEFLVRTIVGEPPSEVRIGDESAGVSRTCIRTVHSVRSTGTEEASVYVTVRLNVAPFSMIVL
jgi:hypothetical protein